MSRPSWLRRLRGRRGTGTAATLLVLVAAAALLAPALPLPAPGELHPGAADAPPSPAWGTAPPAALAELAEAHPAAAALRRSLFGTGELLSALGTDGLGRDVLSRLVWGARVSLLVGLLATLVSALVGVTWGLLSGWAGGRVDRLMMGIVDVLYAIPLLFVVVLLVAVLREDTLARRLAALGVDRLVLLYLVIGAVSWLTVARLVRGQVLALREQDFVLAARALGTPPARLLLRHVLPNLWGLVVVALTLNVPRVMLTEAFLSFLGLGVEAPGVSWGLLASEGLGSMTPVSTSWWLVVFPGAALALTLGALNTLGDALRDALDPRLRV